MSTLITLPDTLEPKLSAYCQAQGISATEAVKRALDLLLESNQQATSYELGRDGFGSDQSHAGDISRNSKQLLREKFRGVSDDR